MKLNGKNKPINEQINILKEIIFKNEKLKEILQLLQKTDLVNYYVAAGAVNQTIFNYYHGYELDYGIKDYDIVYYDKDISYEAEDKIIKKITSLLFKYNVDVKNEARVHLWYKEKFGKEIKQYTSVEEAISKWGASVTCIGIRLENNNLVVYAPYGLNDIFNMVIRPIKEDFSENHYNKRAEKWLNKWPNIEVVEWNDNILKEK